MAYQPAFEPAQVGYLDFETRSSTFDLRQVGAYRYATEAEAIVLSYAIGPDAEAETFAVYDFKSGPLAWARMPDAVKAHHARVMAGEAIWAAWNAGFDRAVWNYSTLDFPEMRPAHIIDVMAQATAAGLPPDLAQASRLAHGAVKLKSGRDLIKLFCLPGVRWRSLAASAGVAAFPRLRLRRCCGAARPVPAHAATAGARMGRVFRDGAHQPARR